MKRMVDSTLAALGLALTWPLLLLIALAIRLDSRGPALFRQERVGRNCTLFRILKFRTMRVNAEASGPGVTPAADPRVTRIGRFLRASKLDELPQLWNVLVGEMSLVGPRPELPRFVRLHPDAFREILKVRPGITDLASLRYRNESALLRAGDDPEAEYVRSVLPDKIRLARLYMRNAALGSDLRLLAETLFTLAYPAKLIDRVFGALGRLHEPLAMAFQAGLAALANVAALLIRFDGAPPAETARGVFGLLPALVAIRVFWFWRLRLHRDLWKYFGQRELCTIAFATVLGSVSFALLARPVAHSYPPSVLALDGMLCVAALAGVRIARCVHERLRERPLATRSVLVVGGSDSAERFLLDGMLPSRRDRQIIGLVTDRPATRGKRIHGVPVVGCLEQLRGIVKALSPEEIVVLASGLPVEGRGAAIRCCRASGRPVKVVPDLDDILRRDLSVLRLWQPQAEDILFRKPVPADLGRVGASFRGRRVLVTGAGGSIGSEICRQIAACSPDRLAMFEMHEESLYQIDRELRRTQPEAVVEALIGDVRDAARVRDALESLRPDFVFHAAAYKHVPMMERNPAEAFRTNVLGTRGLAQAAARAGVGTFVLVSTDKAVEPAGVMGASKRMAELAVQALAPDSATRFLTVRFGNVLESSGSVIPLFREQIESGGPVTVTHRDMTRWFMTVTEAVHLMLEAANLGSGGEVFVLDMGKPVRILDVAGALIRQYGLRPGVDIPIVFTGLRPGERLYERLFNDHERVWKTAHPRILKAVDAHANGAGKARRAGESRRLMSFFGAAAACVSPAPVPSGERDAIHA